MPATIKIKNSSTASAVPTSSDLVQGELAVNVTDKRLFTENASGTVVELGTNPTILTMGAAGSASAPVITRAGDTNTGIFFPAADTIAFAEGGTETMRLDSSGNLGLGVTPSAWGGSFRALQVGAVSSTYVSSAGDVIFGRNTYNNGTNSLYLTSNYASAYGMISGQHQWYTAASGTAGNTISFTQAMTLDTSGNLLVASTNSSTSSGSGIKLNADGKIGVVATTAALGDTYNYYNSTAGAYRFYVNNAGTIFATSTTISAISDERLKENIRDIDTGLDAVMALKPRRFDWKEGKGQNKNNAAGFIAQEFEIVFPDSVGTSKAGDDGIEYKNICHEELIPTLVKAIQELKAEIDALKGQA